MSTGGRPRCLIVQPIHPAGLARLRAAGIEPVAASAADMGTVAAEIGPCAALITRNAGLDARAIAAAPHLRVVAVHGTGTDPVDLAAAEARGILVCNTPEANVAAVAEHALALLLALAKRLPEADAATRAGDFGFKYARPTRELAGLRLGLLGFGRVARRLAPMAQALGMEVLAHAPRRAEADFAAAGVRRMPSPAALFAASDAVSLHLPLTPETRGLVDADLLARLPEGALLVNTGRGATVVEADLVAALRSGRLAGAGLDVFASEDMAPDHPLLALPTAILTPHLAGSAEAALRRMAVESAEGVIAVLSGRAPAHPVRAREVPR